MTGIVSAPGLSPQRNLADLPSRGAARSIMLPATHRAPTANDNSPDYQAGVSLWHTPHNGRLWQFQGLDLNGKANWLPFATQGRHPGAVVSGAVLMAGTRCIVPGYVGVTGGDGIPRLFDLYNPATDSTTTIVKLSNDDPDVSTLAHFMNGFSYGRIVKWYNQDGTANHLTYVDISSAPIIDMSAIEGANIPFQFNYQHRNYMNSSVLFAASGSNGSPLVTLTTPNPNNKLWIVKGDSCTGTNVPANTTVVSVNYITNVVTLSANLTGAPGSLSFAPSQLDACLNIPVGVVVPWQTWSCVMSVRLGAPVQSGKRLICMGYQATDAFVTPASASYSQWFLPGSAINYGFRIAQGSTGNSNSALGIQESCSDQVIAFSMGGTNGRDCTYLWEGQQTFLSQATGTVPATNLAGGCIGLSQQQISPSVGTGDFWMYDLLIFPKTISAAEQINIQASITMARGWTPQVKEMFVLDGSSLGIGNGTESALSWGGEAVRKLWEMKPMRFFNLAASPAPVPVQMNKFASFAGLVPSYRKKIIYFQPGLGNSLQAGGTLVFTSANTSTGVLTLSGTNGAKVGPGMYVSGGTLPAGAFLTVAVDGASTVTVDPAHLPTSTAGGTLTIQNMTAAQTFAALQAWVANAITSGYAGVVLDLHHVRGTYTGTIASGQFAEDNTLMALIRELWPTAFNGGVVGIVNWRDMAQFGADTPMTVTGVNLGAQQITVPSLSPFAAVNSAIRWPGMPVSLANNTGGQYITAITGSGPYTLTLSGVPSGLTVGGSTNMVACMDPQPWVTDTDVYPADKQHGTPKAFQLIGGQNAQFMLDNANLLLAV